MSNGINKCIILGRLTRDPEMRYMQSGESIANISIATSEKWKDKQSGEQKEKTEFHQVVAFKRLAEIMAQYLKKGSQVYIEGRIQTEKWQDKQGNDRYTTKIYARELQMLDSQESPKQQNKEQPEKPANSDFDDDIPF